MFIVIAYGADVRNFLLDAKDLGMMDGSYAFFTMEITLNGRLAGDGKDAEAIEAFEGTINVVPTSSLYCLFTGIEYSMLGRKAR